MIIPNAIWHENEGMTIQQYLELVKDNTFLEKTLYICESCYLYQVPKDLTFKIATSQSNLLSDEPFKFITESRKFYGTGTLRPHLTRIANNNQPYQSTTFYKI